MNDVSISGTVVMVEDMTNDVVLSAIKCGDDGMVYYLYWNNNCFDEDNLLGKQIVAQGKLEYIEYRKKDNDKVRRILSINVRRLEVYEL